jgi:hypothetical protein
MCRINLYSKTMFRNSHSSYCNSGRLPFNVDRFHRSIGRIGDGSMAVNLILRIFTRHCTHFQDQFKNADLHIQVMWQPMQTVNGLTGHAKMTIFVHMFVKNRLIIELSCCVDSDC